MKALGLILVLAAFGCTDSHGDQGATTSAATSSGQGGMAATAGAGGAAAGGMTGVGGAAACGEGDYPPGPYGTQLGDVVANLQLRGYVNDTAEGLANAQPLVDVSFDDVRKSCKGYALVHVSDYT
jgi:hypothetical protein